MEFLSICFTTTVNQIATTSKYLKNFKKLQLYISCFSPCYRDLLRRICSCACIRQSIQFACPVYCFSLKIAIYSFSFKQSRHCFVLTFYGWHSPKISYTKTGSFFEALILQSSFDSCVSFAFSLLKDFLCLNILFKILFLIFRNKFLFESYSRHVFTTIHVDIFHGSKGYFSVPCAVTSFKIRKRFIVVSLTVILLCLLKIVTQRSLYRAL